MILVAGATGFIGHALVRQLSAIGQQVRVLLRPLATLAASAQRRTGRSVGG